MTKHSYTFSIPKPCSESWLKMSAEEKGNFCYNCQKIVIDFSCMTDDEIIHVIENTKGSICGRFNNTQLNRPMYYTYSTNVQRPYPIKTILAGIIALTLIQPSVSKAYTPYAVSQQIVIHKEKLAAQKIVGDTAIASDTLRGWIIDEFDKDTILSAEVHIEGVKEGLVVNPNGHFTMAIPEQYARDTFRIEVIISKRKKYYFQVTPEQLRSKKEQLFVIFNDRYMSDGIVVYEKEPEPKGKKDKKSK